MITISRAKYEAMQAQLDAESAELAQALFQNRWVMKQLKLFGSSSEQMDQLIMERFAHLFNEAEVWDTESMEPTQRGEKKKPHKHRFGSIDDMIPEGAPVEIVEHSLP